MTTLGDPDYGGRPDGHNDEDCGGRFSPVYGSGKDYPDAGPDAVVCPLCGAWRPVADVGGEPDGPAVVRGLGA